MTISMETILASAIPSALSGWAVWLISTSAKMRDKRFDVIDESIKDLNGTVRTLSDRVGVQNGRVGKNEVRIESTDRRASDLSDRVMALEGRQYDETYPTDRRRNPR